MSQDGSILGGLMHEATQLGAWLVNDVAAATVDLATWFFRGSTDQVAFKLAGALVLLTGLFVYAFRVPDQELSTPVGLLVLCVGVVFWGAALMVVLALLYNW